LVAVRGL